MAKNVDFLENSHTVTIIFPVLRLQSRGVANKMGQRYSIQHIWLLGLGPRIATTHAGLKCKASH